MGYGKISTRKIDRWFARKKIPGPEVDPDLVELQCLARRVAIHIRDTTPVCSEQTKAMQFLRDVVHWGIEAKLSHPLDGAVDGDAAAEQIA